MFTKNVKRGRPRGRTKQGDVSRSKLAKAALKLIAKKGYEAATLREIAKAAGVSPALAYKYFPSKQAIVLGFYEELSHEYAVRADQMPSGPWRTRFLFALGESLETLAPHRKALKSMAWVLVGDPDRGVLSQASAEPRARVESRFVKAVTDADDALSNPEQAEALGRLLYLAHLAVLLFWLLDRSPKQRATHSLLESITGTLPVVALTLRVGRTRSLLSRLSSAVSEGIYGSD